MNHDKIMPGGNLDNIAGRLTACGAILHVIHAGMGSGGELSEALYGACGLLESICRDFQADIEAAGDYQGAKLKREV